MDVLNDKPCKLLVNGVRYCNRIDLVSCFLSACLTARDFGNRSEAKNQVTRAPLRGSPTRASSVTLMHLIQENCHLITE